MGTPFFRLPVERSGNPRQLFSQTFHLNTPVGNSLVHNVPRNGTASSCGLRGATGGTRKMTFFGSFTHFWPPPTHFFRIFFTLFLYSRRDLSNGIRLDRLRDVFRGANTWTCRVATTIYKWRGGVLWFCQPITTFVSRQRPPRSGFTAGWGVQYDCCSYTQLTQWDKRRAQMFRGV